MNQYGRFAEQSWQMLAPARYAALEDPNHFFSTLGQEAQTRVVWLAEQMQGRLSCVSQPGKTVFTLSLPA